MTRLIRLEKPPIIEAVAEIRFQNDSLQSAVIFGSLYPRLSEIMPDTETLPILEMPSDVLDKQPELKYAVHYRMKGGNFLVGIGKRMLSINYVCFDSNYEKWSKFKEIIDKVIDEFLQTKLINEVESVSVRYVNLFDKNEQIENLFKINLTMGESQLNDYKNINIAATKEIDGINSTIQLGTNATLSSPLHKLEGTVLVLELNKKDVLQVSDVSETIELLHSKLEDEFYIIMNENYIKGLGPIYE